MSLSLSWLLVVEFLPENQEHSKLVSQVFIACLILHSFGVNSVNYVTKIYDILAIKLLRMAVQ